MDEVGGLDKILGQIGNFGPKQCAIFIQICIIVFFHSTNHIAFVFTAMDPDYRCLIPECDDPINPIYQEKWLSNAIPFSESNKPNKCEMYAIFENFTKNDECPADKFHRDVIIKCSSYVFEDNANYLGREFDILCPENKWKLTLIGSINCIGWFFGLSISGFFSDRYGRKLTLFGCTLCSGITGILKTFSPTYFVFCTLEFVDQLFASGTYVSAFVLGAEMVTPENRKWTGCAIFVVYAFAEVLVGIIAWTLKDWKLIIYVLYIPTLLTIFFYWTIPESSRWYLSKGEVEKSKEILKSFAKSNGKDISSDSLGNLSLEKEEKGDISIIEVLKSRILLWRFINCIFVWMSCAFLYYGITLNVVNISDNSYMDFIYISFTEVPAYVGANYLMEKIGRKKSLSGSFFIATMSFVAFIFVGEDLKWLHVTIYCLGKFGSTAAFYVIYFVTSESFPTPLRQTTMGICSTMARLGSLTSPQVTLLDDIWQLLPIILFASIASFSCVISIFLPETVNLKLPDTIKEAELIGRKSENKNNNA